MRYALVFVLLAACSTPRPGELDQPGLGSGPSCDDQVDNAVIARNVALAAEYGTPDGGTGNVLGWGLGQHAANAQVNQAVGQFLLQDSALYTPPPSGGTPLKPYPYWQPEAISISATYNGKLAFARSFGYGDRGAGMYAEPDSRFRLASVSKTFTAMAILKLIHDGSFGLDYQPFNDPGFITHIGGAWKTGTYDTRPVTSGGCGPAANPAIFTRNNGCGGQNPELANVTVNDLLHHAGGWAANNAMNISWPGNDIWNAFKLTSPPTCAQVIRYFLDQPLQYVPGAVSDYSNFGFCVLGEIIAYKGGDTFDNDYGTYVDQNVFQPLGMVETGPGLTLVTGDREVSYFELDPNLSPTYSVFGGIASSVPYGGGVFIEGAPGSDGWVSSAIDLARFGSSIVTLNLPQFPPTGAHPANDWPGRFLTLTEEEESYDSNVEVTNCTGIVCTTSILPASSWYGMGWDDVWTYNPPPTTSYFWDKGGGFSGTATLTQLHFDSGWTVTVLMNGGAPAECGTDPKCVVPYDIGTLAWTVYYAVNNTAIDYFKQYTPTAYTAWQAESAFNTAMTTAQSSGQYPVRIDGRSFTQTRQPVCNPPDSYCPPITTTTKQFRARLGAAPTAGPLLLDIDRACDDMTTDLNDTTTYGGLVSLQKFLDPVSGTWRYQAVFDSP